MIWILVFAGWLVASPLIAWAMGTAVELADRETPPYSLDEETEDKACPADTAVQIEIAPELAVAG
jgi:hypothetical protein